MSAIAIAMPAIVTTRQPFQMENAACGPLKVSRNKRSALDETWYISKIRPAGIKQKKHKQKRKADQSTSKLLFIINKCTFIPRQTNQKTNANQMTTTTTRACLQMINKHCKNKEQGKKKEAKTTTTIRRRQNKETEKEEEQKDHKTKAHNKSIRLLIMIPQEKEKK